MTSRSSFLLCLTLAALPQAGCLGWDTAVSEFCGGSPNPRPAECGPRTLGLTTRSALVFGETGLDTRVTGLATVGLQTLVASELASSGQSAQQAPLSLYSPDASGDAPVWTKTYLSGGAGLVHLAGVASIPNHAVVGGHFQTVLDPPGVAEQQTSEGGDRPFLHVLDLAGQSVGFWARDPTATGSASVLSVSAAPGIEDPEFMIVGTFTGDLQFDGSLPVHSNPSGRPSLFAAIAQWNGTSIVFRRSWEAVADSGGMVELLDAKLAPDGVACLVVRANGTVRFNGATSARSYSAPTLALFCVKPDGLTLGYELNGNDARLAAVSAGQFYVALASARGLEGKLVEVQSTLLNLIQVDTLAVTDAGFTVGAVDTRPDGSRLVLGTYVRAFAPGPGLRLDDPRGRDLFLLRIEPGGRVVGANAYHQDGDAELPTGLAGRTGGASFAAAIAPGSMIDLGPGFQVGSVATTPQLLVNVAD